MSVPQELLELPQWVLWRYVDRGDGKKPTKVPISVKTGHPTDIKDRAGYGSFYDVTNGHAIPHDGIGFCLTGTDVISAFDLDDPWDEAYENPEAIAQSHMQIIAYMDSYTERSPSKRGARIFFIGTLPDGWRNRVGKVEVYSRDRFLTFTGDHWQGTPLTINHRQEQLEEVGRQLELDKSVSGSKYESKPQTADDAEVFRRISQSSVGADFLAIYNGNHTGNGRSEFDLRLANYICSVTENKEQAERIFRASAHFAGRTKLHSRDDLVARVIDMGFDAKIDTTGVDVSALQREAVALEQSIVAEPAKSPDELIDMPDGLLGFIMYYLLSTAPRPIPAFALAGSIGLLAGIAGRAYNVNGQGLNQYVVTIGESGMGKDLVPNGVARLIHEVSKHTPSAKSFIGPDYIQSASALIKQFQLQPSFVSLIGEFGKWLQSHAGPKAPDHKHELMANLLKVYGRSGRGSVLGGMVYSDKEKNVGDALSPALTLLGDTVPDNFYSACSLENVKDGTIPRFLLVEYEGARPPLNEKHFTFEVDEAWVRFLADFCANCHALNQKNAAVDVGFDSEALQIFKDYMAYTDKLYNDYRGTVKAGIWSRAYLKALKLAALYAVGCDVHSPIITAKHARWAIELANRDVRKLYERVKAGEVEGAVAGAAGDNPKHVVMAKVFRDYVAKPYASMKGRLKDETSADMHDNAKVVRFTRFKNLCLMRKPWKDMPTQFKAKDFEQTVRDLNDIFKLAPANAWNEGDPTAMHRWNIHSVDTLLIACSDVSALKRLLATDDDD